MQQKTKKYVITIAMKGSIKRSEFTVQGVASFMSARKD